MNPSNPHERFRRSMVIGMDEWRDGIGYDLDAFAAMTPTEKDAVAAELRSKPSLDWRDMEVLKLHGGSESFDRLRDVLAGGTPDQRAHALRELIEMGKMSGSVPDVQLSHVLDVVTIGDGMTTALLLAEAHAGPRSRAALLRGVRDRPEVAVHFAALLYHLAGLSDDPFDWNMRPLFLRFRGDNDPADRARALAELCALLKVDPADIPDAGSGRGVDFPAA